MDRFFIDPEENSSMQMQNASICLKWLPFFKHFPALMVLYNTPVWMFGNSKEWLKSKKNGKKKSAL